MTMTAKEMFEELGFKFEEQKNYYPLIGGYEKLTEHKFVYSCNPYIGFKYSWFDVTFDLLKKEVDFHQNSLNWGGGKPIGMDLLQAINKQVEELGWL